MSVAPCRLFSLAKYNDDIVEAESLGLGRSVGDRTRHASAELTSLYGVVIRHLRRAPELNWSSSCNRLMVHVDTQIVALPIPCASCDPVSCYTRRRSENRSHHGPCQALRDPSAGPWVLPWRGRSGRLALQRRQGLDFLAHGRPCGLQVVSRL